jgi:hypothetical protein
MGARRRIDMESNGGIPMPDQTTAARFSRRALLTAAAGMALPAHAQTRSAGLPGPYRGRVVEVHHSGSVLRGKVERDVVRAQMARGMRELTGAKDEASAWKRFFNPKDVVGVKVCPVGRPLSISQPETILEVIRGLNLAGVPNERIVVFNRYRDEAEECGYHKILPAGVRWACAVDAFDEIQTALNGYDPETYVQMERVLPGQDAENPVNRRSHLCNLVSKDFTKVVNVCALKDHASAGVTMALKNLSHGLVNNVSRSHATAAMNWCDTFIPTVVAMPTIRRKTVLNIGDGLIGTYDGGPGIWNRHFRTWEYRALFFSTDPVAMDRVAWEILDAKRVAENLPKLAETGRKLKNPGHEGFDQRQPEHVLLAARAGLGEADLKKIDHRRIELRA